VKPERLVSSQAEQLLGWWQTDGRRDPAQKPWMFKSDGTWPLPEDSLSPYGIWIAEVMLQPPAVSAGSD